MTNFCLCVSALRILNKHTCNSWLEVQSFCIKLHRTTFTTTVYMYTSRVNPFRGVGGMIPISCTFFCSPKIFCLSGIGGGGGGELWHFFFARQNFFVFYSSIGIGIHAGFFNSQQHILSSEQQQKKLHKYLPELYQNFYIGKIWGHSAPRSLPVSYAYYPVDSLPYNQIALVSLKLGSTVHTW